VIGTWARTPHGGRAACCCAPRAALIARRDRLLAYRVTAPPSLDRDLCRILLRAWRCTHARISAAAATSFAPSALALTSPHSPPRCCGRDQAGVYGVIRELLQSAVSPITTVSVALRCWRLMKAIRRSGSAELFAAPPPLKSAPRTSAPLLRTRARRIAASVAPFLRCTAPPHFDLSPPHATRCAA